MLLSRYVLRRECSTVVVPLGGALFGCAKGKLAGGNLSVTCPSFKLALIG
jgi:hypothetical protein